MTTVIPEEDGSSPAVASGKKPKANKKTRVAPRRASVAPALAKSARKAMPPKTAPKRRTKPDVAKPKAARGGSKTAKILDLLQRPGGATPKELMKATGWLPHSVRGLPVPHGWQENGPRRYVHQGRGWRAELLCESLNAANFDYIAPPGFLLAALLVLKDSEFRPPVRQRQA